MVKSVQDQSVSVFKT